jgi:hypothetical protein
MGVQKPAEKPKQKALCLQGFCVAVLRCPETLLFRQLWILARPRLPMGKWHQLSSQILNW